MTVRTGTEPRKAINMPAPFSFCGQSNSGVDEMQTSVGQFDFLKLHDSVQDTNVRRLLRVYNVLPKFDGVKEGPKAEQAILVTDFLRRINEKLKKEVSPGWKKEWVKRTGYNFAQKSVGDWFIGRSSPPLIAFEKLVEFGLEKEVDALLASVQYISSTTRDVVKIPKYFTPDLLYFCGIILGDGSLSLTRCADGNWDFNVKLHSGDKENLEVVSDLVATCFDTKKPSIYFEQNQFGSSWFLQIPDKIIYRFLVRVIGIPNGKKSGIACIPRSIKALVPEQAVPFLAGLVDSDIGKHGKGMGCTFKSKLIIDDLIVLLRNLGVEAKNYGFHYKNKRYIQHDFSIPKAQVKRFKDVLEEFYLPKRKDRVQTLHRLS